MGTSVQIHLVSLTAIVDVFALQFYVYVMLLQNLPVQLHCVFPLFIQHSFCINFFIPHFAHVRQSRTLEVRFVALSMNAYLPC